MPCDYKKYPADWKQIVERIKRRAHDRCELCGLENGWHVLRPKDNWWLVTYVGAQDAKNPRTHESLKPMGKIVRIVLTVHHIDYDVNNNKLYNLLALCQRCHNKLDMPLRIRNRNKAKD